jgi:cytochrome c biogenesis protein ResB
VSDIRSIDPDGTPLAVRHTPTTNQTSCHTLSVTQAVTSGRGSALNVDSHNTDAPLIRGKGAGPLVRLYDTSGTLRFEVANDGTISTQTIGALTVTGNATVGGTLGVTGAAALSSTLAVTGASTFTGAVTINNDLTLQGSGKAYRFRRSGSALDLDATGVDLLISNFSGTAFNGTQRSYFRLSADAQNVQVAGKVEFVDSLYGATRHVLDGAANALGFHGATPVAKQTVSGSRGANAALADLITKLATLGLITDGTSA